MARYRLQYQVDGVWVSTMQTFSTKRGLEFFHR